MSVSTSNPLLVSDLLAAACSDWTALPLKIRELYDAGRVRFAQRSMTLTASTGALIVLSPEDLILFRDSEPYALVHLH